MFRLIERPIIKYRNLSPSLKAGFWFTVCNFLQKGVSFITVPIFTRIMSKSDYGVYSVYTSWYSLLTIFLTLNLSYYVFSKGMVKYEDDRDKFVLSLQSLNTAVTSLFLIVYILFSNFINGLLELSTPLMICMLLQILLEPTINYFTARNRFEYKYKLVLIITLGITVLNPLLGILFIKLGLFQDSVFARALSVTVITVCVGTILYIYTQKKANCLFSTKYWKYALAFNIPLIPHFLSQTILNQADRIMIKELCNASDVAIYSVAYSIGMAVTLFSQAIQQAFLPWLYQNMKKNTLQKVTTVSNVFIILMATVCLAITIFAPELILLVGSSSYKEAIWVFPPICSSAFFIFLQGLFSNISYYFEETKKIALASVFVAVLNILLNAIFIKRYGFIAAGYTTLVCYILYSVVHYYVMRKACKKNKIEINKLIDSKFTLLISGLFIIITVVINLLYVNFVARLSVIIICILLVLVFRKRIVESYKYFNKEKRKND